MSSSSSLGQKLKQLLEINGTSSAVDSAHFQKERRIVNMFYEDVKGSIIHDINAGLPTRPIIISASGSYHDVFWIFNLPQERPVALDRHDNGFRDQWDNFLRWLSDNDLKADLYFRKDAKVVHDYWFELRVTTAL